MLSKSEMWNKFIEEICFKDIGSLNEVQKNAVLCFWYDAEMNSGGHSGYFDCYENVNPNELINAINEIAYKEISDNFKRAIKKSDWEEEDDTFYEFQPALSECIMDYLEKNEQQIFS